MSLLEIKSEGLFLDNKEFYLISGDIHYFRVYPGGIKRRLELAKAFGLTAVQTYVPGELLKENNVIEIFEQYGAVAPATVSVVDNSILI